MTDLTKVEAEDVQRLDNVLADTGSSPVTRRSLVARAATGAAAVGALGALGPVSGALASSDFSISRIETDAITAEAMAVTLLTHVVEHHSKIGIPKDLVPVLEAANHAEYDHFTTLRSLGAKPTTERFWFPDSFFDNSKSVFETIEYAEKTFINAYLIAITAYAKKNQQTLARYAGEICGVESEHRTLARSALGKVPPNNVGFEEYKIHTMTGIIKALEAAGIGFGTKGSKKPGDFYHFHKPPASTVVPLEHNKPA